MWGTSIPDTPGSPPCRRQLQLLVGLPPERSTGAGIRNKGPQKPEWARTEMPQGIRGDLSGALRVFTTSVTLANVRSYDEERLTFPNIFLLLPEDSGRIINLGPEQLIYNCDAA